MTQLSNPILKDDLINQARELVAIGEQAFAGLAIVIVEIEEKEKWRDAGYDSFVDFYVYDLRREKSTISRLRAAGKILIEAGYSPFKLPQGNLNYKRVVQVRNMHPEMKPELVVSTALTWNPKDVSDEKKELCKNPEYIKACKHCWATPEKHA